MVKYQWSPHYITQNQTLFTNVISIDYEQFFFRFCTNTEQIKEDYP